MLDREAPPKHPTPIFTIHNRSEDILYLFPQHIVRFWYRLFGTMNDILWYCHKMVKLYTQWFIATMYPTIMFPLYYYIPLKSEQPKREMRLIEYIPIIFPLYSHYIPIIFPWSYYPYYIIFACLAVEYILRYKIMNRIWIEKHDTYIPIIFPRNSQYILMTCHAHDISWYFPS
jgi:hypothetical protein